MTTINPGQVALFPISFADASEVVAPVTGGTATISDYATAYVASTSNPGEYMVVGKVVVPAGQKISFSVVFSGALAVDGSVVADLTVELELDGNPTPPVPIATHAVLGTVTTPFAAGVTVPPDPGAATIPIK